VTGIDKINAKLDNYEETCKSSHPYDVTIRDLIAALRIAVEHLHSQLTLTQLERAERAIAEKLGLEENTMRASLKQKGFDVDDMRKLDSPNEPPTCSPMTTSHTDRINTKLDDMEGWQHVASVPLLVAALRVAVNVIARALPHIELKRDCLANAVDNYPLELRQLDKLVGDMKDCAIAKALEGKQ
jgi:hypothetical protein